MSSSVASTQESYHDHQQSYWDSGIPAVLFSHMAHQSLSAVLFR